VAAQLKESKVPGRVRLLGTPAEEGGGGKVDLITNGAYKGVDACLMAHPAPLFANYSKEYNGDVYRRQVACEQFEVIYKGKNAHAAFAPWQGINALDAVVIGYNSIGLLRQQMEPSDRVHGIIVDGGVASNIIPDRTHIEYMVRTKSLRQNAELKKRVMNCFVGAATATGCEVEFQNGSVYADMVPNVALCRLFTDEMGKLGLPMWNDVGSEEYVTGATDQGNVSYVVPSIHPNYGIPAGIGAYNHTIGFTEAAISEEGFNRTMTVAKGQAMSAWKILTDDAIAKTIKDEFDAEHGGKSPEELALVYSCGEGKGRSFKVKCHCSHAGL
jgi:amidohydrolase